MNISVGQQEKYYVDNKYYKYDDEKHKIYYGASEVISYRIAQKLGFDEHIPYWLERNNGRVAVVSKDFCLEHPRQTDLWSYMGGALSLINGAHSYDEFRDKLAKLSEFTCTPTVKLMFMLWDDLINLNIDRHFGNITLLCDQYGMSLSPHYDFGQGWLVSNHYVTEDNVEELIRNCVFEPFQISYDTAVKWYSRTMSIPVDLRSITPTYVSSILCECAEYYPESYLESRMLIIQKQIQLLKEATNS